MDFLYITWSFLEAGHGKGAADGIGVTLRSSTDRLVAEGKDLPDARAVFDELWNV